MGQRNANVSDGFTDRHTRADVNLEADGAGDAQRARRLLIMRAVATSLLGLMAAIFVVAGLFARRFAWLGYVQAFAEAGMVGACADWFAVTALFRRPLGLPIPHTGIVPRNKDRIGAALGVFIADNFLTPEVLEAKLRQLEVARWGAAWLREPQNADRIAGRLVGLLPELLDLSSPAARVQFMAALTVDAMSAVPAGPLTATLLRVVWSDGRGQMILDRGLDLASHYLTANEALIRTGVADHSFRWLPKWIDRKIADKVLKALGEIVEDMRAHDHPWRGQVSDMIGEFISRLDTDPALQAKAEAFKRDMVAHPAVLSRIEQIVADLEARLRPRTEAEAEALTRTVTRALTDFGAWLDARADAREIFNAWARLAAQRTIAPRRHEIGRFIAGVVADWDARGIVEKLELQVGSDLQYIRINGTIVGGLVGLIIFTLSRLLALS